MNKKHFSILTTLTAMFLVACEPKVEVLPPSTKLLVTVFDTSGEKTVDGVVVLLFDSEKKYFDYGYNFKQEGYLRKKITVDGMVDFDSLTPDTKYFIAAFKEETESFKGLPIYQDNSELGYELFRPLNKSSITDASVILTPAESYVSFYSDTISNKYILPLKMGLGARLDTIKQTIVTAPIAPNATGAKTYRIRRGTHTLSVINDIDCNSIEVITVIGGQFKAINLNSCVSSKVSFWSGDDNKISPNVPIRVFLDNGNTYIGEITTSLGINNNVTCKTKGQLSVSLAEGNYTYYATVSGTGNILGQSWQDQFTVGKNDCISIRLPNRFQ
jgi:hypothetical protein